VHLVGQRSLEVRTPLSRCHQPHAERRITNGKTRWASEFWSKLAVSRKDLGFPYPDRETKLGSKPRIPGSNRCLGNAVPSRKVSADLIKQLMGGAEVILRWNSPGHEWDRNIERRSFFVGRCEIPIGTHSKSIRTMVF
jgi:hypothetical protein